MRFRSDPRIFARQLAVLFSEWHNEFKAHGVPLLNRHHSRPEGWADIFDAVATAGLAMVAAHPVHAELRAASPKAAAKDPISLDAILVCRKRSLAESTEPCLNDVVRKSAALVSKLQSAGMNLSNSDRFVILASQALVEISNASADFESVCQILTQLKNGDQGSVARDVIQTESA
jgi:putative DNA methylase